MKRYIALFLALVLCVALVGCVKTQPQPQPIPPKAPQNASPDSQTAQQQNTQITEQQAKEIALNHAGLSEADVTRLHAEYDFDDGYSMYEIEFNQGRTEYSYEIDAYTGAVLSYDKDYDD